MCKPQIENLNYNNALLIRKTDRARSLMSAKKNLVTVEYKRQINSIIVWVLSNECRSMNLLNKTLRKDGEYFDKTLQWHNFNM